MVARTWHGMTPAAKADAYAEFLHRKGLKDYYATPGNRGPAAHRSDLPEFLYPGL